MSTSTSYDAYLKSPHWRAIRMRKLEAEDFCCERCGQFARRRGGVWLGIHVHHKTYERLGKERLNDLEVLCQYCHEVEHGLNTKTRDQIRSQFVARVLEYCGEDIDLEVKAWDELAEAAGL